MLNTTTLPTPHNSLGAIISHQNILMAFDMKVRVTVIPVSK